MMRRAPLQCQIYVDQLFATVESCYVLTDLVACTEVVEVLVVSRCMLRTCATLRSFAASFVVVASRSATLETFEKYNFKVNALDFADFSIALGESDSGLERVAAFAAQREILLNFSVY
ncbi:uncharacterized protein LOC125942377 [Dermacentor silvarum]|uniref:uncharacterized protein LOC125942377 n=1 Tax=Dermacentor silvarum TaxID=543639 RepID=UPI0021009964|nr:uncharacterized protein LOC125942377 [Dermacentor silvarum]